MTAPTPGDRPPNARPAIGSITLAAATAELLLARASGNALAWSDVLAAVGMALLLAALRRPLLPLLVYGAGILVPALWGRGTGLLVWGLCAAAATIAFRRRPIGARATVAGLAIATVLVWIVLAVGEGQAPPGRVIARVAACFVLAIALGPRAGWLAIVALWPGTSERWLAEGPAPAGPDVLLISVDTLRLDAARGMRAFAGPETLEAQSAAPWTLPSLATLQTGLLPNRHGAVRVATGFTATTSPTLAERFAAAGWDTAASAESPFVGERFGLQRGFARFRSDGARPWVLPRAPFGDRGRPLAATLLAAIGVLPREDGGAERRVRDLAEIVRERRDRPLFVWVHFLDAHLPYRHAVDLDLPASTRAWLSTAHRLAVGPAPDPDTLSLLRRGYTHEVEIVDGAIARLRAEMPGAITVITSDHGEEFGEHGGWEHGHTLYQELLAVPLRIEGVPLTVTGPVGIQDVAPTLLAAAGIPFDGLDGRDLAKPGVAALPSMNLLYGSLDARAVRVGSAKRVADGDTRTSYDLAADPGERSPLSGRDALEPLLPIAPGATGVAVPLDAGTTDALRVLGYVE